MDQALQVVVEMNQWIWTQFKDGLDDATQEEIDWRPLPEANNISAILRHLSIEAAWHLASLEGDAPAPAEITASLRERVDSTPNDGEHNLKELEELFTRFLAVLEATTAAVLEHQTMIAYENFPGVRSLPRHLLGFHQALHLATHLGQIRSIRNLYRKTRGERARFFPDNPTFPS
jgi:hypothetical protein